VAQSPSARIVAEYRGRIESGRLRPGDRLPSTRQLTREWGVAIATATRALSQLQAAGLVRAVPGVGTVVADHPGPPAGQPPGDDAAARPERTGREETGPGRDLRQDRRDFARTHREIDRAAARAGGRDAERDAARAERAAHRAQTRDDEPDLSRDRIVRAAVAIADTDGMAAVSMRRIATDLGAAPMSLYRHVPGKEDLVVLMTDEVMGRYPLPEVPPDGWRARLELVANLHWRVYRDHPWLAPAMSFTRPAPIANGMSHTEWAMAALDGLDLDAGTRLHVVVTVFAFVHGLGASLEREVEEESTTGLTSEEWMDQQETTLVTIMSGRFPQLLAVAQLPDFDLPLDGMFRTGLTFMLDGLAHALDDPARVQALVTAVHTASTNAASDRPTAARPGGER
jgi:AcrR family transcriptional regulator